MSAAIGAVGEVAWKGLHDVATPSRGTCRCTFAGIHVPDVECRFSRFPVSGRDSSRATTRRIPECAAEDLDLYPHYLAERR